MDERKFASELEEIKNDKNIKNEDKDKVENLIEVINKRSNPKIGLYQYEKGDRLRYDFYEKGDRYIRYDLENFIMGEWEKGWNYLQRMEMATYANDIDGSDGILVPKQILPVFVPGANLNFDAEIKLSFFHLPDVQLRDEKVYMFDEELTEFLDFFPDGFAHDTNLVTYDHSYYLTLIGIMILLNEKLSDPPSFMIHTGDVAHMGVVSEHYEFLYITNKLEIPWYNVLGNHD